MAKNPGISILNIQRSISIKNFDSNRCEIRETNKRHKIKRVRIDRYKVNKILPKHNRIVVE